MPNELIVSIKADTSGLSAGLADATGQVTAATATMSSAAAGATTSAKTLAAAQAELKVATQNLAEAQRAYATTGFEMSAASKEILLGYEQEVAAAQKVVAALNEQTGASYRAAEANTVLGVSARQSATAGIGILEGRMMSGNRAAGAFLSTTLGLGPVLQAAFPIIGAVALGEVLVDVAEGMAKFAREAKELSNTLGVGWLQAATLEMAGFGKEVQKEEQELVKLEAEHDKFIDQQKQAQASILSSNFGRADADSARAAGFQQEATRLETLLPLMREKLTMDKAVADNRSLQAFSESPALGAIAAHLPDITGLGTNANPAMAAEQARVQQAEIASVEAEIQSLRSQASALITATQPVPSKPEKEKTDNLPQEITRASIEAAHAMDGEANAANQISLALGKQLELNLANQRASTREPQSAGPPPGSPGSAGGR